VPTYPSSNKTALFSPLTVGLIQATGIAVYVSAVSQIMQFGATYFKGPGTIWTTLMLLLLLVTSALVCALITLGYPIFLFLDGKGKRALTIVGWNAFWLVIFFTLAFGLIALS